MSDYPDTHHDIYSKNIFGFWTYIMTDCILFSTLFATFAVLHRNTFGGPSGRDLFIPSFVLTETLVLLTSSFTCGLAILAAHADRKRRTIDWLVVTLLLGLIFIGMELSEFREFIHEGNSWRRSGFLSSFFTLVGTHGAHISVGLLWMLVMIGQLLKKGMTPSVLRRLTCFTIFWHFLDIVWIFIFTLVYLMELQ